VTHQHVDHFGLASALVRRTGCRLGCIAPLAPRLADHWAQSRADERFVRGELRRHGIPPEADGPTARLADSLRYWADAVEADLILEDGDALPLAGRRIVAMHRPGHSPSDTVLWDADRRMLWTGDHLLGRISSNPLIARPLGDGAPPHRALIAYIASMRATAELDAELVLPGHHDPIADHRSLVEGRVGFHEERAVHIHGLLAERPAGAFDLALRIWGDRCYSQAFLVVSEIVAHLELLAERGLVVEGSSATGSVYAAV
jgi:glyoxylase-like metal-dependent hydrolase (beta-lactamase superfamily II)